jgi:uncharacterized membrane-anchored protein
LILRPLLGLTMWMMKFLKSTWSCGKSKRKLLICCLWNCFSLMVLWVIDCLAIYFYPAEIFSIIILHNHANRI